MARKIVVTSGKGGVGKTTVTANLGAALSRLGAKVVVMDTDIGLNNLDVVLGLESKIVYDLSDVIENRCRARQALVQDVRLPNFYVMPSSHAYSGDKINGQNIKSVVDTLAQTFDYCILDCPAGIELGFHRAVAAADEALVITTPHISAIRDADKVITILKSYQMAQTSVVVNRARGDLIIQRDMMSAENIQDLLKTTVAGVVPENDEAAISSSLGCLISPTSNIGRAFAFLAYNIHNNGTEIWDCTAPYRGVMGKWKRTLRKKLQ